MEHETLNGKAGGTAGELTFEQAFAELEETVRRLEAGELAVDEAVSLFERGMRLIHACNARLDTAELRVRQLLQSPDGAYELAPFEENR